VVGWNLVQGARQRTMMGAGGLKGKGRPGQLTAACLPALLVS
jgi:hypothetical protein